jgi:hypothetical protein
MVDRVQSIKWESPAHGGTEFDLTPSEIEVNEDFLDCRGITIQNDTSDDEAVRVSRDASGNMTFVDPVYGLTATLTELAAGGGESVLETRGILTLAGGIVYTETVGGVAIVAKVTP